MTKIRRIFRRKRDDFFQLINKSYPGFRGNRTIFADLVDSLTKPGGAVLDAGCGRSETHAGAKGRAGIVVGIDLDRGIKENRSIRFGVIGTLDNLPFRSASFDLVICQNVIEHLHRPELFFGEIGRILTPKGKLALMTPNLFGYRTILARIIPPRFQKGIIRFIDERGELDTFPTFFRANTVRRLDGYLGRSGLRRTHLEMFQGYPPTPFSLLLTRLLILHERLVNRFRLLSGLRSVIIAVYEKEA